MIDQAASTHRGRRIISGAFVLLTLVVLMATAVSAQSFPRCITGCTANDVEFVEITADVLGSCTPGGTVETNLWVSLYFNRKKTYCVRFVADIYIDGELAIADMVSEPLNVFSKGDYPDIYFGSVSLPCGSSLSLENVQIIWSVDKNFKDVSDCVDGSCEPYGPGSKCTGDQYGTIFISLPLDALDDIAETDEDTPITINVLANDLLGVEPTQIASLENGLHGSTQNNGDGTITYTPDPDFHGIDSFMYVIEDSDGNSEAAMVSMTVYPANDGPTALDDHSETDENESVGIDILGNDSDPDGTLNPSSVDIIQDPAHGTVDVDPATGVITYSPSNGDCGSDFFTYVVEDNEGATSTEATVTVDIWCNEAPVANDDFATTDENTAIEINVASNDEDSDGSLDLPSILITSSPSFGSVSVHPTSGLVTYMPDPLSCGDDTFDYTIADDDGAVSSEATVTVAVLCDDPPLAIDDLYHVGEGETLHVNAPGIIDNDIASPGDPLTVTQISGVSHGDLTLNTNGSFTYVHNGGETTSDQFTYYVSSDTKDSNIATVTLIIQPVNDVPTAVDDEDSTAEDIPVTIDVLSNDSDPDGDSLFVDWVGQPTNGSVNNNGGSVTYTPDPNFHGTDTFSYAATDGNGGQAEATVKVVVTPVNDPPVAQDDSESTDEDTPVIVDVLGNDSDPDGDSLTIQSVTQPSNGIVENNGSDITYIPDPNFHGMDTFSYTLADGNGGTSLALVTVSVAEINDSPVALDDGATTPEDVAVDIDVLSNDFDPDGDSLIVESVTQAEHGEVVNNGSDVTYIPDPDYNGEDTFTYTACDENGGKATATVYVTVLPSNDPPVAQDDSDSTQEDTPITLDVLPNDSDPDGDDLIVQSVTQPADGSVINNGDDVVYTPNLDFSGIDTFTYVVSDGNGGTATATVTVTVSAVNDPPIAEDDEESTDEESPVSINVLLNDSDPDGDALVIEAVTSPEHGSIDNHGTSLTYTPDPNFSGTDTLTYSVSDGNGRTDTATVTIRVDPINDAPLAQDDSATTEEDTLVSIPVILNDSDPDGDFLLVESITSPSNGSIINAGTSVSYIPDPGFNGIDVFTYTVSDSNGGTDTATVTVAVSAVNDPPIALDDSDTTDEDTSVVIDVLLNDSDPDGDDLTIQSVTLPAHGSVVNNGLDVVYTPDSDFNGVDSFTYTISDGNGEIAAASVSITVAAVNDPPIAQDDSDTTDEGMPVTIDVLPNDTDLDGDNLIVQSVTQPANGSVTNNGLDVIYTPDADFNGLDSFTYAVSDGNGGTDTATVTIAVAAVNDPPLAQDDSEATDEDTPVAIEVLPNDSDPDGDTLVIQSLTQPSNGSTIVDGETIVYTPDPEFNGTDTFTYTISDGNGEIATATVSITVAAVNDPPIAQDDSAATDEGMPVTIDVLPNDTDLDGDNLIVQSVTQPADGSVTNNGLDVIYTPDADFNGLDSFTYAVSDGNGGTDTATVTIAVAAVNDPPLAQDDSEATDEDTPVDISVLANDSDPDGDTLVIQSLTQPSNGSTIVDGGTIVYTPDPDFNGVDTFTYTVSDGNAGTATATVTVAVAAVNDPPTAQDDSDSTNEGTLVVIDVLPNDTDPDGDTLTIQSVTQPANGSVVNNGNNVAYTPEAGFSGVDVFTYTVFDGNGETSTATVTVAVAAVNDPPIAQDDSDSTDEGTPIVIDVLPNDSDPDGDTLSVQSVTQPDNGSVVNNGSNVAYIPDAGFSGIDVFTYTISDGNGETSTATVTVTVAAVNDPPIAQDDSDSTDEGTPVVIDVLPNDSDPDGDTLSVQSVTQPDNGSVVNNSLDITYTPNGEFSGIDVFTYTVSDGNGETATATVTVSVAAVNDPPIAVDDAVATGEDTAVTILVLSNDSDPEGDALSVESITQPLHGAVVSNGTSIIYTPAPDYVGPDSFSYTVSDGHGGTSTAIVSISVLPVNDPPVAQDDSQTTQENAPVTILVLSNDSDPDGDPLRVESIEQPSNGIVVNTGSELVYEPNAGYSGTDSFTYTVADGRGGTSNARVSIIVNTLNDPPNAQDDSASTNEGTLVVIPILANDSDPDGDFLLIESFTQPANGSVLNSRTNLSYIPDPGFQGIDTFIYTVSDGNGGSSRATVTVSVAEVNDAPIAQDDSAITDEGNPITILALLNDSDPDGDPLEIESVSNADNGVVEILGTELVYTPDPGFDGVDTFTYTVSDGRGATSTAIVFIAVAPVNDAPLAQDDSTTTIQGESTSVPVLLNDSDPDGDPLVIVSVTQPQNGSVTIVGTDLLYEPDDGFTGPDSFTYTIADDSGITSSATVTIGVDPLIAGAGAAADDAASCEGRVIINEIAWAGTAADARDEWIELRNLGTTAVDLTGWVLRWRSTHASTPEDQIWKIIELEGILPAATEAACDSSIQEENAGVRVESLNGATWLITANPDTSGTGYYVLERRTNDTIQDTQASQIYDADRTLSLELSDLGEIVMLVNANEEVVDTANASNLGRNGWVAGSMTTRGSMERIDPLKPDTADNWQTNFGLVIEGEDAADRPLRATPGIANSPDLAVVNSIISIPPTTVRAGEVLQVGFPLSLADRRATGWPWISVIRPGFAGVSGAGGAVDYTAYAFSGSAESDGQYLLKIDTSNLSTGSYTFWVIYGSGHAVYMPVTVNK